MTVVSCTKRQCKFFLAEQDDAVARVERSSDIPPCPHTPTGKQISGMTHTLLTPETVTDLGTRLFTPGSSRKGLPQRLEVSPTPHRFRDDENVDLPSFIIGLLQRDGLALKSSTESEMRHVIGDRVAGYEAKLQNSAESLKMAFRKIAELERVTGSATY